jgi:hypothetical protein
MTAVENSPVETIDEPRQSAPLETKPKQKRKKKRIPLTFPTKKPRQPQPSTSKASKKPRVTKSVEAKLKKPTASSSKKSKSRDTPVEEPQPSTLQGLTQSEDTSEELLRRSRRPPAPRQDLVTLEVYFDAYKAFAARHVKPQEGQQRKAEHGRGRPKKMTLVKQPHLEIIPESESDAAESLPRSPSQPQSSTTQRELNTRPTRTRTKAIQNDQVSQADITKQLSQVGQTGNPVNSTVETADWLQQMIDANHFVNVPQSLPEASGVYYCEYEYIRVNRFLIFYLIRLTASYLLKFGAHISAPGAFKSRPFLTFGRIFCQFFFVILYVICSNFFFGTFVF